MAAIKGASKRKLPPKKLGRPTDNTPELREAICDRISIGKSARASCDEVGITYTTLKNWLAKDSEFVAHYARAKEDCADYMADEINEIADELPDGSIEPQVFTARQRLRVDARKWTASKLRPKKYGDKVDHEVTGANGGPIQSKITVEFVSSRS